MKTFTTNDGFGGLYEVAVAVNNGSREFKLRSTSELSSLFKDDSTWVSAIMMDLGYYAAKDLSQSGFSDSQINEMFSC